MSRVQELHSEDEWATALQQSKGFGGKAVVVDFSATWWDGSGAVRWGEDARRSGICAGTAVNVCACVGRPT
jgi:hypothetical protein